jgi:hypothetical protein
VRLDGTSFPKVPIRVFEGATIMGGTMTDSTGYWSLLTNPLAAGVNVLTAGNISEAGVPSLPSPGLSITIMSTPPPAPPAPTLDPDSGSGSTATVPTPTLDGAGAPAGDTITVFIDGAATGSTTSSGSGTWTYTTPVLAPGSHTVRVMATDAAGDSSGQSDPLVLVVGSSAVPPGAPSLSAVATSGLVTLNWSVPADGGSPITGYDVYRGTSPGAEALMGTFASTTDADTGVTNGITYYYEVSASNGVGQGPRSNEATASPVASGQVPRFTSGTSVAAKVRHAFNFLVTATGAPAPTLTESGELPGGVKFNAATGKLSGTAKAGTRGTYEVVITAANAMGTTQQILTLRITKA